MRIVAIHMVWGGCVFSGFADLEERELVQFWFLGGTDFGDFGNSGYGCL